MVKIPEKSIGGMIIWRDGKESLGNAIIENNIQSFLQSIPAHNKLLNIPSEKGFKDIFGEEFGLEKIGDDEDPILVIQGGDIGLVPQCKKACDLPNTDIKVESGAEYCALSKLIP
jgi:hypothetical protein